MTSEVLPLLAVKVKASPSGSANTPLRASTVSAASSLTEISAIGFARIGESLAAAMSMETTAAGESACPSLTRKLNESRP